MESRAVSLFFTMSPRSKAPLLSIIIPAFNEEQAIADVVHQINAIAKRDNMDITVVVNAIHMKGSRQDITMMGMSGYSFTTDKEGWTFMPFGGQTAPEAMTPQMVKEGRSKLDLQGDFIDYKAKGTKRRRIVTAMILRSMFLYERLLLLFFY